MRAFLRHVKLATVRREYMNKVFLSVLEKMGLKDRLGLPGARPIDAAGLAPGSDVVSEVSLSPAPQSAVISSVTGEEGEGT